MRKWLCAILAMVLLLQALPLNALAAAGHVLSDEELAAAYALTGFGESAVQRNAVFHKGMTPNESWNAMQVSDWLDEMLNTYMFSVEDILSRASVKLAQLKERDSAGYRHFSDDNPKYKGMIDYIRAMYRSAEALREEMRWQQDRLQEQAGLIAELGRKLKDGGDSLYASERVRLSASIEKAQSELRDARAEVAENAKHWEGSITHMQAVLDPNFEGAAEEGFPGGHVGEWLSELSAYGEDSVKNTVPVTLVNRSGSRLGRMSANGSVLSNADSATVHVMTENEVGFLFYGSDGNGGKAYLQGAKVTVKDLLNPYAEPVTIATNDQGGAFFSTNRFTVDKDKNIQIKLDVDAEAQGYRSFGSAKVKMKLGEVRQIPMRPLSGATGNGVVANDDNAPYVYSASFESNDILGDSYEMMQSSMNSWDFEIRVEVRNPGGGDVPEPLLCYWTFGDSSWHYAQEWARPTSHEGNVYIFKNKWKRILAPELKEEQSPFIAFSKDASAERFATQLISLKSVVESPLEEGSDVFTDVLSDGLNFGFHIPVVDMDVSLNLPFASYLPKMSVDLAGFVTISMGSDLFQEKIDDKTNWQSADMEYLRIRQKVHEEENGFANYKAQYAVAYDVYKEEGWQFFAESKIDFGMFGLVSARWEIDNEVEGVTQKIIKGRGGAGILVKYSFSWTVMHVVGPVPVYLSFTLGVNAGVAIGLQVGFSYINGELNDWELKPLKDLTINIAFSFTAQFGIGIKGFLEGWVRFTATMNFRLTLVIMGNDLSSFVISGALALTVGLTIFWVEVSKTWDIISGTIYDSRQSNALPPLQRYVLQNAADEQVVEAATQVPMRYPGLTPQAKAILTNEKDARSDIRVATSNGHTFAFYLDKVDNRQRLCWVDVNTGKKGNAQGYLESGECYHSRDLNDYDFDAWSDGNTIFVVGCCAASFDENGYPTASQMTDPKAYAWIMPLTYWDEMDDLMGVSESFKPVEASACSLDLAYNPRGIANPHIEWGRVTYGAYESSQEKYVSTVEVYGFAERVDGGDASQAGYACFDYTGGRNFHLLSDAAVQNALGSDHERTNLRSSVRGNGGRIEGTSRFRCFSFVSLSRPKDDGEGERAIELYDWEMNTAPVKFTTQKQPALQVIVTDTKRKAVAVKKGDIGSLELVQTVGTGGEDYAQTLFYTEGETNGDGVKQYKLKGLTIGGKKGALSRSLSYDVTDKSYDITVPSAAFEVQTVKGTPYIYWLSTVEKKQESDPDAWRLWVAVYDPATDTVSSPAVYSEFTVGKGNIPRDVVLTENGQGYLTATPIPKEGDSEPQPLTLYSFPLTLKPVLTLKGMVVENVTVAAGDFEDSTVVLMNEGNMGISAFDLEMFVKEDGSDKVVEILHCDCLNPAGSTLTMANGNSRTKLLEGKQAIYRNSDFDYSPRPRAWTLDEEKLTLKASQSDKNSAWTSSLSKRDSRTDTIQTNMLMPGALASFTASLKIPESWSGDKTLYLRVSNVSSYANWQGAMANAAGVRSNSGIQPNAAATTELTWALNGEGDKLVLQPGALANNAAFVNAVESGLIANAVDAGEDVPLNVSVHDIEVDHRVYRDVDGTKLVDIVVTNFADTRDSFKLSCEVFLDGSDESYVVTLPFYSQAVSSRAVHTITVPVAALVPDADRHSKARVVVSAVNRDESAYANNAFMLFLGGGSDLRFTKQPHDTTVQPGEDVSFQVEVDGGRKPYSYQWQVWDPRHEEWVDLPGFTEPTLSRKDVEKKWDGARFRCVVTDAAGTQIISDEVTLTVRDGVDTGDHSNLPLYLIVAFAALALLAVLRRRLGGRAS